MILPPCGGSFTYRGGGLAAMRKATVVLRASSSGDYLLAPSRFVAETPDVHAGTIQHVDALADGTAVVLMWFQAPVERVRAAFGAAPAEIATDVSPVSDGVVVYSHFEPSGVSDVLLGLGRQHEVVSDRPMTFTDDGGLRVGVIGREGAIQTAIDSLPETVSVTLEAMTAYDPRARGPLATLTDRQLETLRLAVEWGYYESPRAASLGDLADELGCSRGTVGEHLRKAERYVLSAVLDG